MLNAEGQELGVREDLGLSEELARNVGSTLNVVGAQRVKAVQKAYLERSRHKNPPAVHGGHYLWFPNGISYSAGPGMLLRSAASGKAV